MKIKKLFLGIICAMITLTISSAVNFTDLPKEHWAYNAVNAMAENGIISGYADGTFKPGQRISRAEFATILVKTLELNTQVEVIKFKDVEDSHWAKDFINNANSYLTGYLLDGEYYFRPEEFTLREDAAVAIVKAKKLTDKETNLSILNQFSDKELISENLRNYVAIAVESGFMKGNSDGTFNPQGGLTRAEVTALFKNIYEYENVVANDEMNKNDGEEADRSERVEEIKDKGSTERTKEDIKVVEDKPFEGLYEAENAILSDVNIVTDFYDKGHIKKYSGTGFIGQFDNPKASPSKVTFEIEVPKDAHYEVIFLTCSPYSKKNNNVIIDENIKKVLETPKGTEFYEVPIEIKLGKGKHTIQLVEDWGYFYLDAIKVKEYIKSEKISVSANSMPVNRKATDSAVELMEYLNKNYGKKVLSGQRADGVNSPEIKAIYSNTKKYPAIINFDFQYTVGKTANENANFDVDITKNAIEWGEEGGIVAFTWHWLAPKDNIINRSDDWKKTFYSDYTDFNIEEVLNGEDKIGYDLLISDIDAVSAELKKLQKAGIPVLWRPLHEASGEWFWWGNSGSDTYIKLWNLMYDRMVNKNGLNNLIWVWNGQYNDEEDLSEWYPGDDVVDIVSEDIYAEKNDYSAQTDKFKKAMKYTDDNKIIALSENGVIPDPDELLRTGAMWSWFATWKGEYVVNGNSYSEEYTSLDMLKKVYSSNIVITLDELPEFIVEDDDEDTYDEVIEEDDDEDVYDEIIEEDSDYSDEVNEETIVTIDNEEIENYSEPEEVKKTVIAIFSEEDGCENLDTGKNVLITAKNLRDKLKAQLSWNEEEKKVGIKIGSVKMEFIIDSDIAVADGEEIELESAVYTREKDGNFDTMLPAKDIAEILGYDWVMDLENEEGRFEE